MPVDRSDHRRRVIEDRKDQCRDRGEDAVRVFGSAVEDRAQVGARREAGARPCEDDQPVDTPDGGERVIDQPEIESCREQFTIVGTHATQHRGDRAAPMI